MANSASNIPRSQQVRRAKRITDQNERYSKASNDPFVSSNVRAINTDWKYIKGQDLPTNAPSDQIFEASYQTKGIQTQLSMNRPDAANETNYNEANKKKEAEEDIQNQEQYARQESLNEEIQDSNLRRLTINRVKQAAKKKIAEQIAKKLVFKTEVRSINAFIWSWALPVWGIQIALAFISLIMLGITVGFSTIVEESSVASALVWIVDNVGALFGTNSNVIQISYILFFLFNLLVFVIGLLTISTSYLIYTFALLEPLSGKHSGLKIGVLILAIAGYIVPGLNFLPWILICLFVVGKYPR